MLAPPHRSLLLGIDPHPNESSKSEFEDVFLKGEQQGKLMSS